MKEIHFWKDNIGASVEITSQMHFTHNATIAAINIAEVTKMDILDGKPTRTVIHTYAISVLDFAALLDNGYDIFLHENGKVCQIKEGDVECTDKEIRKAHDIRRIWIGGGFDDFFYKQ